MTKGRAWEMPTQLSYSIMKQGVAENQIETGYENSNLGI